MRWKHALEVFIMVEKQILSIYVFFEIIPKEIKTFISDCILWPLTQFGNPAIKQIYWPYSGSFFLFFSSPVKVILLFPVGCEADRLQESLWQQASISACQSARQKRQRGTDKESDKGTRRELRQNGVEVLSLCQVIPPCVQGLQHNRVIIVWDFWKRFKFFFFFL